MTHDCQAAYPIKHNRSSEAQKSLEAQQLRLQERLAQISHVILVLSGKGGVGKSTVAANLAWALAEQERRTGLLDADINGPSIPLMLGLQKHLGTPRQSLAPVPVRDNLLVMSISFFLDSPDTPTIWRGPLKGSVIRQFLADGEWGPLDFLIVDLPPGTGDEPLTVAQAFPAADGGIIVTTPQEASLAVCRKAINFLKALRLPCLGVLENMSGFICPYCQQYTPIFSHGGGQKMAQQMGVPFLGQLPLVPEIVALTDAGQPLLGAAAPPALRQAFAAFMEALLAQLES